MRFPNMNSLLFFLRILLLGTFAGTCIAQDYSCSATKPCAIGCCGKNNVCGLGPDYCAPKNCISSCDQRSECDPEWGAQWSSAGKCPLNVCCSKYGASPCPGQPTSLALKTSGFCGTTKEFCGTKSVKAPSCGGASSNVKTIGYYEGWSPTRACDRS